MGVITGTDIELNVPKNYKGKILKIYGNTEQATRSGTNYFKASEIPSSTGIVVTDNGKTITMPLSTSGVGYISTGVTLSALCPTLNVGDVVYLYFTRNLTDNNKLIYLIQTEITWSVGNSKTITQEMLDSTVAMYGNRYISGETEQCIITDFRIVKNTTDTWEQYGVSPSPDYPSPVNTITGDVKVKVQNGNIFDINGDVNTKYDGITGTANTVSGNDLTTTTNGGTSHLYGQKIYVGKGNTATFSAKLKSVTYDTTPISTATVAYMTLYDENTVINRQTNSFNYASTGTIKSVSIIASTDYIYATFGRANSSTSATFTDIQVEIGSIATPYITHQEQVIKFPLSEGQMLHEGDYLADDGVHSAYASVDLSTLNWLVLSGNIYKTSDLQQVIKCPPNIDTPFNGLAEKYISGDEAHFGLTSGTMYCTSSGSLRVRDNTGTPTGLLEYELKNPTITPYTSNQQDAWDKLKNIILYEGINYINVEANLDSEIELEYYDFIEDYDIYISADGYFHIPKNDKKYLIDPIESNLPIMPEASESAVRIAGRDGDLVLNTTYEPIPFEIVCYTEENLTPQEKIEEEEIINTLLNKAKNEFISLSFEERESFYNVKYNGALTTTRYPKHLKFSIPLKSSSPYGKCFVKREEKGNCTFESDTIKDCGNVITIYGPATNPKISLNDYEIYYDYSLLDGDKLEIDSSKSTITHINSLGVKTNAMRFYNHQFPKIKNGTNQLTIINGISSEDQVTIEWYDLKI